MFVRDLFIHLDVHSRSPLGAWAIPHTREGAALSFTILPS
jgi:hypothetical protein